jgi:hypothetical protein
MHHSILADLSRLLPAAITAALPLAIALERTWTRARCRVRLCGTCGGFGNRSGRAEDIHTVCVACNGTGWTHSRNLIERVSR